MNTLYTKLMTWLIGEALANSDRMRVMAMGLAGVVFTRILGACPSCNMILTPDVVNAVTAAIGIAAVGMVGSLTHRDVGAAGETVPGAAVRPVAVVTAPVVVQ